MNTKFVLATKLINQLKKDLELPKSLVVLLGFLPFEACFMKMPCHKKPTPFQGCCNKLADNLFSISIKSSIHIGSVNFYSVLAHEMRHVQQYSNGTLSTDFTNYFIWENRKHPYKDWPYLKQPHEADARKFADDWTKSNLIIPRRIEANWARNLRNSSF